MVKKMSERSDLDWMPCLIGTTMSMANLLGDFIQIILEFKDSSQAGVVLLYLEQPWEQKTGAMKEYLWSPSTKGAVDHAGLLPRQQVSKPQLWLVEVIPLTMAFLSTYPTSTFWIALPNKRDTSAMDALEDSLTRLFSTLQLTIFLTRKTTHIKSMIDQPVPTYPHLSLREELTTYMLSRRTILNSSRQPCSTTL